MAMSLKLLALGAIGLTVLGLAIATGYANPGASRRTLARAGATAFFAFLASFFWLSPFTERGGFLTGMAVFFAIGGTISAWKWIAGMQAGAVAEKSATHLRAPSRALHRQAIAGSPPLPSGAAWRGLCVVRSCAWAVG